MPNFVCDICDARFKTGVNTVWRDPAKLCSSCADIFFSKDIVKKASLREVDELLADWIKSKKIKDTINVWKM